MADGSISGGAMPIAGPERATPKAWVTLFILALIAMLSQMDRYLPFVLSEAIKHDLQLTDAQVGIVGGLAFAVFHSIFVIPFARLADAWSRRWLIALAVAFWSVLTAATSVARSYPLLFALRAGVAVGEAGSAAPSHSLIGEYFPVRLRATALALLAVGSICGTVVGAAFGGYLADRIGWRGTFLVFGSFGVVLAIVAAIGLGEGIRTKQQPGQSRATVLQVFRSVLSSSALCWIIAAASVHMFASSAMTTWMPPFLIRQYELSAGETGLIIGTGAAIAGLVGTLVGGALTDRLAVRDARWYLWLPAIGVFLCVPIYSLALFAATPNAFLLWLIPGICVSVMFSGPTYAMVQNLADPANRTTVAAIALLVMNFVGGALGPPFVGWVSDLVGVGTQGGESIRVALLIALCANIPAALFYLIAARADAVRALSPSRHIGDDVPPIASAATDTI